MACEGPGAKLVLCDASLGGSDACWSHPGGSHGLCGCAGDAGVVLAAVGRGAKGEWAGSLAFVGGRWTWAGPEGRAPNVGWMSRGRCGFCSSVADAAGTAALTRPQRGGCPARVEDMDWGFTAVGRTGLTACRPAPSLRVGSWCAMDSDPEEAKRLDLRYAFDFGWVRDLELLMTLRMD